MDHAHLQKLKADLHHLSDNWERVQSEKLLIEDSTFLQDFAMDIRKLDDDLREAEKVPEYKEPSELIEHLIRTPWGAPFVFETPLLDAARNFDPKYPDSKLQRLLQEFLHYQNEINEQLFNCITEIEKKLDSAA